MVNQDLSTLLLDELEDDNISIDANRSFHLTERKLSKLSLKKWTVHEFNLYMRFAVFISISPLYSQASATARSFEYDTLLIIFEIFGCIVIVWRTFYIAKLAFIPRSIEIEFVKICIIVNYIGFFYFFIKSIIIMALPNEADIYTILNKRESPIVSASVYFIINLMISGIDMKILYFLKYYLNYNFDGYDCDDDDYLRQVCFLNKTPLNSADNK